MKSNPVKILLFNTGPDTRLGVGWAHDRLRKALPNAVVTVLDLDHNRNIWSQWKVLLDAKTEGYDRSIFPYQPGYLCYPWYWLQVIMFLVSSMGARGFITLYEDFMTPKMLVERLLLKITYGLRRWFRREPFISIMILLRQPFISIMLLFHLPIYFFQQVLGKFVWTREKPDDEFVGFGKGKGVGGLIYWLTWTRKVKRYGLCGLVHDTYMGMPISVHSWPIAVAALGLLGFRRYVYLSAILASIGLGWLAFASENYWSLILIPLVLCSTYFLFNIYVSTWEILAWGIGFLAFAATYAHLPLVAGIFLAAVLLTHPGAGFLTSIILTIFVALNGYPLLELVWLGLLTAALTIWWIVPYLWSRHKLGRDFMINQIWKYPYIWDVESLYQFITYTIFFLVSLSGSTLGWVLILLLPLLLLYYNVKIRWNFSKYTLYNFVLLVGAIYLTIQPTVLSFIAYLLVIYTSSELLWPGSGSIWGFDLTPVVLGATRDKVKDVFTNLKPGRVALEIAKSRENVGWSLIGPIGYIMAEENVEILNPGYTEIGDSRIFEKFCQYFNVEATPQEFEVACQGSGVKYMIAFTEEFCQQLDLRGYKKINTLTDICLSDAPNGVSASLTLYELPWSSQMIVPEAQFQILPGEMRWKASAGQTYFLRYSAFQGWRAFQHGRQIPLMDAHPGMMLTAEHDGEVVLKYRYRYYWW